MKTANQSIYGRIWSWLEKAAKAITQTERQRMEAYLAQSSDHADLEHRIRAWEQAQQTQARMSMRTDAFGR